MAVALTANAEGRTLTHGRPLAMTASSTSLLRSPLKPRRLPSQIVIDVDGR